jgi:hypothetical protein
MTTPDPGDDRRLDARVRQAAERHFDDIAVTEAVLARVHARSRPVIARRPGWAAWAGPMAFASVLLATPFVVAFYPGGDDALLVGLATGDPGALFSDAWPGFAPGSGLE